MNFKTDTSVALGVQDGCLPTNNQSGGSVTTESLDLGTSGELTIRMGWGAFGTVCGQTTNGVSGYNMWVGVLSDVGSIDKTSDAG